MANALRNYPIPQPSRKSEATLQNQVRTPRRVSPGVLDRAERFAERRPFRGLPSARIHATKYRLYRLLEMSHAT